MTCMIVKGIQIIHWFMCSWLFLIHSWCRHHQSIVQAQVYHSLTACYGHQDAQSACCNLSSKCWFHPSTIKFYPKMYRILTWEILSRQQMWNLICLDSTLHSSIFKSHYDAFSLLKWSLHVAKRWVDWLYSLFKVLSHPIFTQDHWFVTLTLELDLNHSVFQVIYLTINVYCSHQRASILGNSLLRWEHLRVDSVCKQYCHNWDLALLIVFSSHLLRFWFVHWANKLSTS